MRIARTLPEPVTTSSRGTALAPVAIAGLTAIALLNACSSGSNGIGGGGGTPQVFETFFAPVSPLEERHVDVVVRATIDSIDFSVFAADADPRAYVVVMDRLGNYMGLYAHGVSGRTGLSNPNLQDPAVFLPTDDDRVGVNAAAAVARAAAYLSHSEAPLTSRTGEFLATFHSPALFEEDPARFLQVAPNVYPGVSLPVRPTNGITNTGLADLWQIDASNRGSFFAQSAPAGSLSSSANASLGGGSLGAPELEACPPDVTTTGVFYQLGKNFPISRNPDNTCPSGGLGGLPGGVPLYIRSVPESLNGFGERRHVGAVGCYITALIDSDGDGTKDLRAPVPDLAEGAAFEGSRSINPDSIPGNENFDAARFSDNPSEDFAFASLEPAPGGLPNEGGVFLVGILLPYIYEDVPAGLLVPDQGVNKSKASNFDDDDVLTSFPVGQPANTLIQSTGAIPGENFVLQFDTDLDSTPETLDTRDSIDPLPSGGGGNGLTAQDVRTLIVACDEASQLTSAAIRFPSGSQCRMWIAITDRQGNLIGAFRQPDATIFSYEIALTKARNAAYFSDPLSVNGPDAGPLAGLHPLTGLRVLDAATGQPIPGRDADGQFLTLINPLTGVLMNEAELEAISGTDLTLQLIDCFPRATEQATDAGALGDGVAITARTLGFLSAPNFPPTIDANLAIGPLAHLVQRTRFPRSYRAQAYEDPPNTELDSGIIFFPGAAPLYRNGNELVGGIGVSGDGVSEDDFVTDLGIRIAVEGFAVGSDGTLFRAGQFDAGDPASFGGGTVFAPIPGLLPNENIRCDSQNTLQQGVFLDRADGQPVGDYQGVAIPYQKFPQFPNG